jgi:hypothetical protein
MAYEEEGPIYVLVKALLNGFYERLCFCECLLFNTQRIHNIRDIVVERVSHIENSSIVLAS